MLRLLLHHLPPLCLWLPRLHRPPLQLAELLVRLDQAEDKEAAAAAVVVAEVEAGRVRVSGLGVGLLGTVVGGDMKEEAVVVEVAEVEEVGWVSGRALLLAAVLVVVVLVVLEGFLMKTRIERSIGFPD